MKSVPSHSQFSRSSDRVSASLTQTPSRLLPRDLLVCESVTCSFPHTTRRASRVELAYTILMIPTVVAPGRAWYEHSLHDRLDAARHCGCGSSRNVGRSTYEATLVHRSRRTRMGRLRVWGRRGRIHRNRVLTGSTDTRVSTGWWL